ncbi:MAG: adenosylcobinamide-phosphate synthase CbiB [Pyramidobacter sp.]|jgi:adenosylcobinamide-phosphate synthase
MNEYASVWALAAGCILDLLFGDPHGFPHVVVAMGRLISVLERFLRPRFPATPRGEARAGALLTVLAVLAAVAVPAAVLWALDALWFPLSFAAQCFLCFQLLAARSLRDESLKVAAALREGDVHKARHALSMIVGRDTQVLDESGIIRAAVETVAENTSDGVIAPLLWMGLFGALGGCFFKAANTMDSMIAYKNKKYRWFGACAAYLDDAVNFFPARLAGLLMVLAAPLCGLHGKNAWRVFRRDRLKHESPNAAHTEAACAGALGVQLGGPAVYEGRVERKAALGDALRPVEIDDIGRAHRLLFASSALAALLALGLRAVLCALLF